MLELLASGYTNAEIATELIISHGTAKTHVARALQKLGLRDRVQAVIFAYENGLVQPGSARASRAELGAGGGYQSRSA